MWYRPPYRLALLELFATGELRRRVSQAEAWDELNRLGWARRTSRRDELVVDPAHREDIAAVLDRCWPDWRGVLQRLEQYGLTANERGWKELQDRERVSTLPPAPPPQLNVRTATAAVAAHSKARLTELHRELLDGVDLTRDNAVRIRPCRGMLARRGAAAVDASEIATLLGELVLTERAFREGTVLDGTKSSLVILVENVGTFIDLPAPDDWTLIHVPGWNTGTLRWALDQFPAQPCLHFGDLDPNGVAIAQHVKTIRPDIIWAVPDFWSEFVTTRGLRTDWPAELPLDGAPTLVRDLASRGLWLEQEVITFDPRLGSALAEIAATHRSP